MASLQQNNINETYEGLLKTFDNNTITISNRVTDGKGQCTALTLGSTSNASSFDGNLTVNQLIANNTITTDQNLCVKGNTAIDGNLTVTGDTQAGNLTGSNFLLTGPGTFGGGINFDNCITVTGISNLSDTNVTGDLNVTGTINSTGDIIAFVSSDNRLKDNLLPIESNNYIDNLTGYEFDWNERSKRTGKGKGILAQDLYKIDKTLVKESQDGYLAVDYIGLIPVLIEEVKRLGKEIEDLKKSQSF
jgi:hypothetical protein|tara:strand:- start:623 stop:1363 length:741 start_codon:yes stop_codon:yes gene_type:complete